MVVIEFVNVGEVDEFIEDREMLLGLGKVLGGKIMWFSDFSIIV